MTYKANPVPAELAINLAAATGSLISMKGRLLEPGSPIWCQHAVRCARDGVFRNTFGGCKVTANEIISVVTRGRNNYTWAVKARYGHEVGREVADYFGMIENCEIIVLIDVDLNGSHAQRFRNSMRRGDTVRWPGRKIHHVAIGRSCHGKGAARRLEDHLVEAKGQTFHDDRRRGKCRVATQWDLDRRRKPAQVILTQLQDQECGFGQVVFSSNRLHRRIVGETRKNHHRSGVSRKALTGKRIDLKKGYAHLLDAPRLTFGHVKDLACRLGSAQGS